MTRSLLLEHTGHRCAEGTFTWDDGRYNFISMVLVMHDYSLKEFTFDVYTLCTPMNEVMRCSLRVNIGAVKYCNLVTRASNTLIHLISYY